MFLPALITVLAPVNAYYLPIEPLHLSAPVAALMVVADPCHPGEMVRLKTEVETVSAIKVIDARELESTLTPRSFDFTIRPGFEAQQIRCSTTLVATDPNRTSLDFNEIASVEVIRDGANATYGRDALSGVLDLLPKGLAEMKVNDRDFNPHHYIDAEKEAGWTQVTVNYQFKDLFADTSVYKVETLEGHQPTRNLVLQKDVYLGTFSCPSQPVANFQPDDSGFWGKGLNIYDKVGGIKFTPEYADKLGIEGLYLPRLGTRVGLSPDWTKGYTTNTNNYMQDSLKTYGAGNVTKWVANAGLNVQQIGNMMNYTAAQGTDMNKLSFPGDIRNTADAAKCGSEVYFPAGTTWLPDKPGYQGMTNITGLRYQYNFEHASHGVEGIYLQQAEARTHCLNMNLKEPAAGVRYFPYAPSDPMITELAKVAEASNFRGPWDQARTWIYTDKASMDEINKRVMLGIRPAHYVNALWEVASRGGFSQKDLADKRIFDPKLLACAGARKNPMQWFVSHMAENHGKEVRAWLEKGPTEFGSLLTGKEEYEKNHLPAVLPILLASRNSDARVGALAFLKRVGASEAALKDKVGDFRLSLYSSDAAEVEMALDACSRFSTDRPADALRYLAENGKNDKIKNAAKALIAS